MFSAKNYGLPKDLIEAAKRVHEKQLEEAFAKFHYEGPNGAVHIQRKDGEHVARFWKRENGSLKRDSDSDYYTDEKSDAHNTAKKMVGENTEEKLAEAFAIFLEENFHIDMLTEEDLDYVFENEFPQWLEEGMGKLIGRGIRFFKKNPNKNDNIKKSLARKNSKKFDKVDAALGGAAAATATVGSVNLHRDLKQKATADAVKSDTMGGHTSPKRKLPPLPVRKPKNEEVQFTEEELAEAFAIFLEENFHVDMLTEEDLDYVFEEEFPQWLEEARNAEQLRKIIANTTNPKIKGELQRRLDALMKGTESSSNNRLTSAGTGSVRPGYTKPPSDTAKANKAKQNSISKNYDGGDANESEFPYADEDETDAWKKANKQKVNTEDDIRKKIEQAKKEVNAKTPAKKPARKQVRRSAPKPQSFGALLRKVGGNAPATSDTAAGRAKIGLLDARARARTAAKDAIVRKTGRGQLSWAKKAFEPSGN